ncbi:MAG: hypothetical protein U9Q81_17760, partial [Pseudomonadota bacterium]|nr:hypothetical protein [Pseudomonadota bacterium]
MKSTAVQCFIACKRGPVGAARRVGQNASAPPLPGGVAHVVSELASAVDAHWVASAENQIERDALARWPKGVEVDPDGLPPFRLSLVDHQSDVIRAAQDRLFSNILWRALHAVWDDIEEPAFGPEDARSWVAFRQFTRDVVDRLSSASFSALNPVYLLQDFQMACVPPLLRKTRPDARQALLLHCAWPSLTDWSKLPRTWRRDLA